MQCFVLRQLLEEFPPVEASWSSPLDECQGLTRDEMEIQVAWGQREIPKQRYGNTGGKKREGNTREKRWKMEVQEVHEVRWIFKRCYIYIEIRLEMVWKYKK